MSDVWEEPTAVAWARHVLDEMAPKLAASTVAISLLPEPRDDHKIGDVKYWVELGAMICMDKPILVVVMGDQEVPPKIAQIADEVVRLPDGVTPSSSSELAEQIKAFAERYPEVD